MAGKESSILKRCYDFLVRIKLIENLSHFALFGVGVFLSINLFEYFGNDPVSKAVMIIVVTVIEYTKLKDLYNYKKYKALGEKVKAFKSWLQYIIKAILSVIASIGFALVLLSAQETTFSKTIDTTDYQLTVLLKNVSTYENEVNSYAQSIASIDAQLDNLTEETGWGSVSDKLGKQKERDQQLKNESQAKLDKANNDLIAYNKQLKADSDNVVEKNTNANDMFVELAKFFEYLPFVESVSPLFVKTFIFLVFMIMLEVSIASTAPEYEIKEEDLGIEIENNPAEDLTKQEKAEQKIKNALLTPKKVDKTTKEKFKTYAENMYKPDLKRLHSVKKVSELTGMSIEDCRMIRETLENLIYQSRPLVISGQGFSKSTYKKEDTIVLIDHLLTTPPEGITIPQLSA